MRHIDQVEFRNESGDTTGYVRAANSRRPDVWTWECALCDATPSLASGDLVMAMTEFVEHVAGCKEFRP